MPDIVLATCAKYPEILPSDQYLADALKARGATVSGAPWNHGFAPFAGADWVIVRSTWDYFDKVDEFYAWFDRLESAGVKVSNSLEVLRWNARKNYLFELIEKGASVIPTLSVEASVDDIATQAKQNGWKTAVLKCLVSGTALGLSRFDAEDPASIEQALRVAKPWSSHGLMLQPFMPQISTDGELSCVFINGQFSHAVQKKPKANEFRVQSEYGGQYQPIELSDQCISECAACLSYVPGYPASPPLYARVDGLIVDGRFCLMELELTEPELMFALAPTGADRMAEAIITQCG